MPAHASKRGATPKAGTTKRWSQHVTETSDALDLQKGVFSLDDPRRVARSLKRSAEQSKRRKADPFRSAMSMLNFYINRAGKKLPKRRLGILERAKDELRDLYHAPRRSSNGRKSGTSRVSRARKSDR